ncbi:hypothetical protein MNL13_05230 [Bartonella krasnovii]|uniref:Uncharacterized protein n=1 Tax=Bartonella krasnovii TaxID=2267275 RepID=A0A5B9D3Q1_9HYPH|nr:hypothetical protein [Bartonella krasnovii]QEE12634.1 hypothetical protein D1092_06565 [Bartonella krasnovii]UNF28637.1 hypothetical protein MNL13_05230 [Bartonella krasnovii]UNF35013.1 hypothetical protein MNL12_05230 [Bartonella krasnovii]UNF36649.1 hypothetical protein MNL11_05960 [Bartonella krasnovii]UNF38421.1 hypothetical protein MNL10_06670 [Bartonella krasnovii]
MSEKLNRRHMGVGWILYLLGKRVGKNCYFVKTRDNAFCIKSKSLCMGGRFFIDWKERRET